LIQLTDKARQLHCVKLLVVPFYAVAMIFPRWNWGYVPVPPGDASVLTGALMWMGTVFIKSQR